MDTNRVIVATLTKRRALLMEQVTGIDAALAAFGGSVKASAPARTRRSGKRRTLTPEQIAKMQAGRKASREAKDRGNQPDTPTEGTLSPIEEARAKRAAATADTGHAQVPRGASLAEAAS